MGKSRSRKGGVQSDTRATKRARQSDPLLTSDDEDDEDGSDDGTEADDSDRSSDESTADLDEILSTNSGVGRAAMKACEDVLLLLRRHEDAEMFLEPVDLEEVPDYREIVSSPMDFSTIKSKLDNCEYTPRTFADDCRQVFMNCALYNPEDSPEGAAGIRLQKYFEVC